MKKCTKCGEDKELEEFQQYKRGKKAGEYHSWCKPCFKKPQLARRQQKKEKAIEYLGGKCNRCGKKFHHCIYEFHHLDPKKKDVNVSKLLNHSWETIKKEVDKCELLCASCHKIRHHETKTGEKVEL
jgi:hypothetical protein